jgi:predicted SAM-dependent methyltransferase
MKKVLNVGGNSKDIPLPGHYADYEHLLLDIDPRGRPDILCDARTLTTLEPRQFDAIYCAHNLEHYYAHDVPKVLAGFLHVLKDDGFAEVHVPDIDDVMRVTINKALDIEDVLYDSPAGPVSAIDIIYGLRSEIEESGHDFFAHKTGFTRKSLTRALECAGFVTSYSACAGLEIRSIAFKQPPTPAIKAMFGLPG